MTADIDTDDLETLNAHRLARAVRDLLKDSRSLETRDYAEAQLALYEEAFRVTCTGETPHSPNCKGTPRYYDGLLGYEAMRCDVCGFEQDLNAEANAKATSGRLLRQFAAAAEAYVRARNDGGVSMADLSTIADRKIRAALEEYEKVRRQ